MIWMPNSIRILNAPRGTSTWDVNIDVKTNLYELCVAVDVAEAQLIRNREVLIHSEEDIAVDDSNKNTNADSEKYVSFTRRNN